MTGAMTRENGLLAALGDEDRALLDPYLSECTLLSGSVIYEPGDNAGQCYFPLGSVVCSYLVEFDGSPAVETILLGREGVIGGLGGGVGLPSYARLHVIHGGRLLRIDAGDLDKARRASPAIAGLLSRYADCLMAQVHQSIGCNAVHSIEQRAARWLVAVIERIGVNDVTITQEQLASTIGVGRSYASRVLQRFKRDGLLRTRRGGIEVLDREGLRARACTCNDRIDAHFRKVLTGRYSGL